MITPPGIGLDRLFAYPLARWPERVALIDERASATFAELDRNASRLAAAFASLGARKGDRIASILPNGIPFIAVELAILRGAMVKVPLNIRFHPREVLYALADCAPTILVCDRSYAAPVLAERERIPSLKAILTVGGEHPGSLSYEAILAAPSTGAPVAAATYGPDDPALIRYTGGTTGRPKGIVHTAASLLAIALDQIRELAFTAGDVALHLGHLSHGLNFTWPAYYAVGACQVLRERFEPRRVLDDFACRRVTCVYMVPTMIQRLLREDDGSANVSSLRMFMYASAPMPVPLLRQAMARYGNIFLQVYTLSEAPVITTLLRPEEHCEIETRCGPRLGSCGREVITMELRLLDEDGAEVAEGEVGEIALRSANNMAGYWQLPEETARTLVDGWVLTGDMARRDEEGYLHLVDRKKDVIITGAFNVYPKEVEDVLYRHPAVAQCAVIGVPDEEWGETIKAFIVLRPGGTATAEELVRLCREHLAGYKKPRQIAFVESLPLSPVGKIMRRALREE